MSVSELRLLLWKDLHQHRAPVIGAGLLLVGPFVLLSTQIAIDPEMMRGVPAGERVRAAVNAGAAMAMFFGVLVAAVFGGAAFAGERQSGAAEVVQMLVPSRRRVLLPRAIFSISAGCSVVFAATGLFIATLEPAELRRLSLASFDEELLPVSLAVSHAVGAFGVGWACSSVGRSAAISGTIGIAVVMSSAFYGTILGAGAGAAVAAMSGVGPVAFIVGCVLFLRRTEP